MLKRKRVKFCYLSEVSFTEEFENMSRSWLMNIVTSNIL